MGSRFYWDKVEAGKYRKRIGDLTAVVERNEYGRGWTWDIHRGTELICGGDASTKTDGQQKTLRAVMALNL